MGIEDGAGILEEDGVSTDKDELFKSRGESGEGAEGGGVGGFVEPELALFDKGFDVVGCDVRGEICQEATVGRWEFGVASVHDLDG